MNAASERWEYGQQAFHGYPIEWLKNTQQFKETYIIVNAIEITEKQFHEANGAFKGM